MPRRRVTEGSLDSRWSGRGRRAMEDPVSTDKEAHILLIEPAGTPNTGNAETAAPRREL